MINIVKCPNLVLGYKGNRYREHKWILVFLKLKGLIKKINKRINKRIRVKR